MRYAIIADIHGNLEALESVLESCRDQGVRQYYCVGDVVGYGADPVKCIAALKKMKAICIAGNHDWAVSGIIEPSNFSENASKAAYWTRDHISSVELEFLKGLDLKYSHEHFQMVHGSLNRPEDFIYIKDTQQALDTFYLMERKLCFIAHTHVPQIFTKKGDVIEFSTKFQFEINDEYSYLINVGSVGQPRDGNPQASFCIYDPDLKRVEIMRVTYDIATAQEKILKAGMPDILAHRLAMGQ